MNKVHIAHDTSIKRSTNLVHRSKHTTFLDNYTLIVNEVYTQYIDMDGYSKIHIYGSSNNGSHFYLMVSGDKMNDYLHKEIFPTLRNTSYHFSETISDSCRYITIYGGTVEQIVNVHYTLIK